MQAHSCMGNSCLGQQDRHYMKTTQSTQGVWNPTQHNRRLHSRKQPQPCTKLGDNGNVQVTDRDALCVDKASELPAGIVPNSTQLQDPVLG